MNWYYAIEGRAHGPVDDQRLAELAANDAVGGETLIWQPAMSGWEPVWKARPEIVAQMSNADLAQKARGTTDRIPIAGLVPLAGLEGAPAESKQEGAEAPRSSGLFGRLFSRIRGK